MFDTRGERSGEEERSAGRAGIGMRQVWGEQVANRRRQMNSKPAESVPRAQRATRLKLERVPSIESAAVALRYAAGIGNVFRVRP